MITVKHLRANERRFWSKIEFTGFCWLWTGRVTAKGYAPFWVTAKGEGPRGKGTYRPAHIVAYRLLIGPVPKGLVLDHLCRIPHCINPDHLEPVTSGVNTHRSPIAPAVINAAKTHCHLGHEFTPENTLPDHGGRWRACRACQNRRNREYQARKKIAS